MLSSIGKVITPLHSFDHDIPGNIEIVVCGQLIQTLNSRTSRHVSQPFEVGSGPKP